ncbi:type II secretion system secretin GspD [Luminiphilus sp.]|nr:type II secretion system secretin GspD [Luminiphilus sp.]
MLRIAGGCAILVSALLMQSCATQEVTTAGASSSTVREDVTGLAGAGTQPQKPKALVEPEDESSRGVIFEGTDQAVRMPPPREPIKLYGDAVSLNFEEAPLSEVVHSVLGDILELDYIVEHPVQGAVTLRTRSPVPREQLLPILESLLHNHGALMVRGPNNRLFISGAQNASRMSPSFQNAAGTGTGFSNVIVPLQYIGATEMAEILKPVATDRSFVRIDVKRNLLVLAGTQMQINGWLDIVTTFDIDQLAGTSVGVFPIARGPVDDVFVELEHILNSAEGDATGLASMVRVLPVERLNSILVVSPRAAYIEMVGNWVKQLDSIDEPASESTLHVYEVLNGQADQMAMLLSTIFAEDGSKSSSGAGKSQVAPGMQSQRSGSGSGGSSGAMPSTGAGQSMGGSSFKLGESIRVVSDDYNNALLVYASPYEYGKIERILKKLDVIATQVLIEASIVEVTLNDGLQYGVEWAFENGIGNDYSGVGSLDLGAAGLGAIVPGFSYTVKSADSVRAVVNALAEKSLVNVISTPSVLVLDNHTAAIHVGDQQPIQSMVSVTDGGVSQTSINYKDTGVKLEVTPSVNDGGLVTLDVMQSVTDVGPQDSATGQRSFTERNLSSRIAVRSGDSVVLGGLIRDNESKSKSGVPFLMDIPVLGSLFSNTSNTLVRTELLVFITPKVVETDDELRALSVEMRDRMQGITDFSDVPIELEQRKE